ncbi:MAG: hypothetical protein ABL883_03980 [Terricaulis sp.]
MSGFDPNGLWQAIGRQTRQRDDGGRVILLTAGRRGEGVTRIARALAVAAGPGPIFALDLDLRRNQFARELAGQKFTETVSGDFCGVSLCVALDSAGAICSSGDDVFCYRRVGGSRLHVGVLDARAIPAGGRLRMSSGAQYWDAVRASGATFVVDAPAIDQGKATLAVARHVDAVVLVVGSSEGAAPAALAAKGALDGVGAPVIGIVYAGASGPVLALERAFTR